MVTPDETTQPTHRRMIRTRSALYIRPFEGSDRFFAHKASYSKPPPTRNALDNPTKPVQHPAPPVEPITAAPEIGTETPVNTNPHAAPTRAQDLDWVRNALRVCDLLTSVRSLSYSDRALLTFAIRWAPYGGTEPEELFTTFGVPRTRFLQLLHAAMAPRPSDPDQLHAMKETLHIDLARAWRGSPTED